jgi:hypothetical protein
MVDTPDLQQNINALAGRRIVDVHIWAVREGLRGTKPAMLFMGLCQRLVDAGVPVCGRSLVRAPCTHNGQVTAIRGGVMAVV